uniref:Regulator of G protein signaling 20 n=1 Tax=Hucho hucho TaxID=62062 RepID=A0A4W5NYF6_9TELE
QVFQHISKDWMTVVFTQAPPPPCRAHKAGCAPPTTFFPQFGTNNMPLYLARSLFCSPKPILEDAMTWTMSFERLMKSSAGRGCFRQFLRTEFSEENMMFWLACEELKKETNKTVVEEKVRQIYEDFISILSPKEVSLDSRVRDVINKNMLEPTSHTFEDAQHQIYTLMQRDSYPRYMNSTAYADLLQDLAEQPPVTEP